MHLPRVSEEGRGGGGRDDERSDDLSSKERSHELKVDSITLLCCVVVYGSSLRSSHLTHVFSAPKLCFSTSHTLP